MSPQPAPGVRACCLESTNLEVQADHPDARADVTVAVCRVCGARHFEQVLDSGTIEAQLRPAG